jgi:TPP-dependent pyruvate/acetoin dehydrogenase alpha subunit
LDKIEELLYTAKAAKDLGAASMALTAVYNVKQLSTGAATRISGNTTDGTKAKVFDEYLKKAREKMKLTEAPLAVEVEAVRVLEPEINDKILPTANNEH